METLGDAISNFRRWLNMLDGTAESILPQVSDAIYGDDPTPMDMEREQAAEIILRDLSKRIEDVMSSFDGMLEAISMSPRYKSFFDSLELTNDGWRALREVLKEYRESAA